MKYDWRLKMNFFGDGVFKYSPRTLLSISKKQLSCIHQHKTHLLPHEQYQEKQYSKINKIVSGTSLQHLFIEQSIKMLETQILQCTRGFSERVLLATISRSCCWSALAAWSPEDGSWLSEVVVLEELNCISLCTEDRKERDCFKQQYFPNICETLQEKACNYTTGWLTGLWNLPPSYLKSSTDPQSS